MFGYEIINVIYGNCQFNKVRFGFIDLRNALVYINGGIL